jgi:hypothetical protein
MECVWCGRKATRGVVLENGDTLHAHGCWSELLLRSTRIGAAIKKAAVVSAVEAATGVAAGAERTTCLASLEAASLNVDWDEVLFTSPGGTQLKRREHRFDFERAFIEAFEKRAGITF